MPDLDLDPIRERVNKATPGPWVRCGMQVSTLDGWFVATTDDDVAEGSAIPHDAELIAHAPTDLRDLIAEVGRLRAQVERVRATLDPADADPLHDPYARGYAEHSRQVRKALEGN